MIDSIRIKLKIDKNTLNDDLIIKAQENSCTIRKKKAQQMTKNDELVDQ